MTVVYRLPAEHREYGCERDLFEAAAEARWPEDTVVVVTQWTTKDASERPTTIAALRKPALP